MPQNQVDSKAEGLLSQRQSYVHLEMVDRVLSNLPGRGIGHDRVKLDWLHAGDREGGFGSGEVSHLHQTHIGANYIIQI